MRENLEFVNSLFQMRDRINEMTKTQKLIATAILSDPASVLSSSLKKLAQTIGVSEGSVINFASMLGFDGFSSLRLNIAQCLHPHEVRGAFTREELRSIPEQTAAQIVSSFQITCDLLSGEQIEKASDLLRTARRIEIYGVTSSAIIAEDTAYRLMKLGLPAKAVTDPITCPVSALFLDKGDVVLAISTSGKTHDIIRAVQIAKDQGASIIAVTSQASSSLATKADAVLLSGDSKPQVTNFSQAQRITQMFVIEILCRTIATIDHEKAVENQRRIDQIWAEYYNK